jgi:hypothetical protein
MAEFTAKSSKVTVKSPEVTRVSDDAETVREAGVPMAIDCPFVARRVLI